MSRGVNLKWTDAMHSFCSARPHLTRRELATQFNAEFYTTISRRTMQGFCSRNGYMTDRSGKFQKGNIPFNKGRKGVCAAGCEATQFKQGNRPSNSDAVGTEKKTKTRPGKDPGYWKVKIEEPNVWAFKHRIIWENKNGPVPKGHIVIFKDTDVNNFSDDNLVLLSRGELAILNKNFRWKEAPNEHRDTLLLLSKLQYVTGKLSRGEKPNPSDRSFSDLCEAHKISAATVVARLRRGIKLDQALSAPLHTKLRRASEA